VDRAWTYARGRRSGGGSSSLLGDQDTFLDILTNGDVERCCEMRKDNLATVAAQDVILPEIAFFERERTIVIGGQRLGIGAESSERRHGSTSGAAGVRGGRRGGTQLAREGFFKVTVAIVRRHGLLLP
jgi:hypothetical protein